MKKEILTFPDNSAEAKAKAVEVLTQKLNEAIRGDRQVLFLMSGGTWVDVMNQLDGQKIDMDKLACLATLTSLDDRLSTGADNNFKTISETSRFVRELLEKGAKTISTTPTSDETNVEKFGQKINTKIQEWIHVNGDNGYLLATVGVGGIDNVEGHIAGIAPSDDQSAFDGLFVDTDELFVGYHSTLTPPLRVTATFKLLERCDKIVLILGKEKKGRVMQRMLNENEELHRLPAAILLRENRTSLVTDINTN